MRAAVLVLATACASSPGSFRSDGFHHAVVPYQVRYGDPGRRTFVSSDWQLDNYVQKGDRFEPKTGEPYRTKRVIDLFNEEAKPVDVHAYDLRLRHRRDNGTIWMRAEMLQPRHQERALDAFIKNYVENLSGTGFYASDLVEGTWQSHTHAAVIVEARDVRVSDLPAREAIIDIANVDRLKLDPASRSARMRLVVVDTPYKVVHYDQIARKTTNGRCIVVVGYTNDPDRFAAGDGDFERFLASIHFPPAGLAQYPIN